jgi:phosphatidylserine decarboxylase
MKPPLRQNLFALPQYALPQHTLSRLMRILTHSRNRRWKNFLARTFVRVYGVDMAEALEASLEAYPSFNDFFTRSLKADVRPLCADSTTVASPADGVISQIGDLDQDKLVQAKGRTFTASELLGGDPARAAPFIGGHFATIYLSPRDYHRLHMPVTGTLQAMLHVPGRLFSVNAATTASVPNLFARNERVVTLFKTEAGPMALVLVGAIFVSSIETVWHGVVTPPTAKAVRVWDYATNPITLARGDELGRFNMGSTIIILFPHGKVRWGEHLSAGSRVRVGQALGRLLACGTGPSF